MLCTAGAVATDVNVRTYKGDCCYCEVLLIILYGSGRSPVSSLQSQISSSRRHNKLSWFTIACYSSVEYCEHALDFIIDTGACYLPCVCCCLLLDYYLASYIDIKEWHTRCWPEGRQLMLAQSDVDRKK